MYESNPGFPVQVVSVCQTGTLVMWMVDTGQKVKQFHKIHGNNEVTSLTQDPSQTRLFTGSTDGTVKVGANGSGQRHIWGRFI